MEFTSKDHTFAICAYKENPYLEDCILSVMNQTVLGNVMISTSTPNEYIKNFARKYNLSLVINHGKGDQVGNLNFAYSQVKTPLVTLCHQDDYYCPTYLENILEEATCRKNPILIYTDYYEDRNGERVDSNRILRIKRILNFPLHFSMFQKSRWMRRRILSFGCPICCPSVTFCKTMITGVPFSDKYCSSLDWEAWVRLSTIKGDFIYCDRKLVAHRIWDESETSITIADGLRSEEDYNILCSLWPGPIAKIIFAAYRHSQNSNASGN